MSRKKTQTRIKEFDKIVAEMRSIMIAKNTDYGDDNISHLGEKGIYVRIWDKVSRLRQLVWLAREAMVKNEKIEDTLMDLANYALIMIIYLRGKWKA